MFAIDVSGFEGCATTMLRAAGGIAAATEYALASTAKMVRNKVKSAARGRGASGFENNDLGWPKLSPFTGTISGAAGSQREAFGFARRTVRDFGWKGVQDVFINKSAINSQSVSGKRTTALRKEIRRARGKSVGYKSRERNLGRGLKTYDKLVKLSKRSQPFARMINYVQSRIFPDQGKALISLYADKGSNTPDQLSVDMVEKHARGFTFTITGKMRRFLFAIGAPTSASSITVQPRPWFSKVFTMIEREIQPWFNAKFASRVSGALRGLVVQPERMAA